MIFRLEKNRTCTILPILNFIVTQSVALCCDTLQYNMLYNI